MDLYMDRVPNMLVFVADLRLSRRTNANSIIAKITKPKQFDKLSMRSGSPKGHKTPKKCPLCHFLDPQERVLGEMIFEDYENNRKKRLR